MSQTRNDLSTSKKTAREVVRFLSGIGFVTKIYINGSRSPNGNRPARKDSDWDFICVCDFPKKRRVYMRSVRESHKLHGDVIFITKRQLRFYEQAAEIYPNDAHGVLK